MKAIITPQIAYHHSTITVPSLYAGIEITKKDHYGDTPLQCAMQQSNVDIMQQLLNRLSAPLYRRCTITAPSLQVERGRPA